MKKRGFIKELEKFGLHHKVFAFIIIMCLTIALIRLIVMIHNPNPIILNFELHHFDYGLLLLLVVCLLLLFGKKKYSLYLLLSAISFGLILDELWFIRSSIVDSEKNNLMNYITTFPIVVFFVIVIILIIFLINYLREKRKNPIYNL